MKNLHHLILYFFLSVPLVQLCQAQTSGALARPVSVVSRLSHGSGGTFDIPLPLSGKPGVEGRTGNGGSYTIILAFPETVTFTDVAITTAGVGYTGSIAGTSDGSTPNTQVTINLASVSDGQTIKITLHAVRHETNNGAYQNDVSVEMGIRIGDVDGNGVVTTSDRAAINGQIGMPVSAVNFRDDVNNDGAITSSDRSLTNGNLNKSLNYTTFSFTLDGPYQTSAGVYKDGRLIRTLWSNIHYPNGTYTSTWDGNDDAGAGVAAGSYEIRLLQHNVRYIFDGAVGNTSSTQVGLGVHNNSCFMRSLALDGSHAYYAIGESEGEIPASHFETTTPQARTTLINPSISTGFDIVATDGDRIYISNSGAGWDYALNGSFTTFITAHSASDNSEYAFPNGTDITKDSTHTYHGCIDANVWTPPPGPTPRSQDNPNQPTGLAVQKGSGKNILAVAHGGPSGPNEIRLFDKISGDRLPQTISVTNPQSLATDSNGDLWVISGNACKRYTNLASTPVLAQTITGFSEPIAVAVSLSDPNLVLVADGGATQQVRAFNRTATNASNQLWSFGQAGGWNAANGPDVTDTPPKFSFKVGGIGDVLRTALAVAADGSFYVGDGATSRLLHVNSAHAGIIANDTIMFLTKHNWTAVDPNNPRRVFGDGWLEFDVDYTKPIQIAWTLKKNWAAGVDPYYTVGDNAFNGLRSVATLSNGRVYGTVHGSSTQNENIVVELPEGSPNSPLRICQNPQGGALALEIIHQADEFRDLTQPTWLSPDGAIRYPKWSNPANPQIEFWERTLSSFDGSGNPQWNSAVKVASAPYADSDPSSFNDVENVAYPLTSSNKIVIFEPGIQKMKLSDGSFILAAGLHLGAIAKGDTQWSWRASNGVTADLPLGKR